MIHLHGICLTRSLQVSGLLGLLSLASCSDFRVPAIEKLKEAETEKPVAVSPEAAKKKPLTPEEEIAEAQKLYDQSAAPAVDESSVNLGFLLSMNYAEAKTISAQSMELPMGVKVAADSIEILKKDRENQPKRVRAKGKVYLENGEGPDSSKILCQEAYITTSEIILRGKPIIQRGGSIIEGLDDRTVAYMLRSRLRVIGLHRLTNEGTMLAMLPDLGPWTGGPNPILPPLAEDAVPGEIRNAMLQAAESEAILQMNRTEALKQPQAPPAPWVKEDAKAKSSTSEPSQAPKEPTKKASEADKSEEKAPAQKPGRKTA